MRARSVKAVPLLKRFAFVTVPALVVALASAAYASAAEPVPAVPASGPVVVSATSTVRLSPSATAKVNLVFTNPNTTALRVTAVKVSVGSVTGPGGEWVNCYPWEFTVRQFSGAYGFTL